MNTEIVTFIDTGTGEVGQMPKRLFGKKAFTPADRILVEPGTKPYVAELYKSQTPETFEENHPDKVVKRGQTSETKNDAVDPIVDVQPKEAN